MTTKEKKPKHKPRDMSRREPTDFELYAGVLPPAMRTRGPPRAADVRAYQRERAQALEAKGVVKVLRGEALQRVADELLAREQGRGGGR